MAITRVGVTKYEAPGNVSTVPITTPTGVLPGDLLIAFAAGASGTVPAVPAGWAAWEPAVAYGPNLNVIYRWAAAGDPASWTWTVASQKWAAGCVAWRGVDTSTPKDAPSATATSTAGWPSVPPVTTVTAGAVVLAFGGVIGPSGDVDITWTTDGAQDIRATALASATTDPAAVSTSRTVASAGAATPSLAPVETVSRGGVLVTALRPASSSTPPPPPEVEWSPPAPRRLHEWSLFARDANYGLLGGLRLSSAQAVIRHLATDTAVIETPYSAQAFDWTAPGNGMVLYRDGVVQFSGLVASERTLGWDATAGSPTIKVSLLGDNVHLEDRVAWPNPAVAGDGTTTYDYWYPRDGTGTVQNVAGSTAIWRAINEHLGPGARAERRVPGLTMGVDPTVGVVRQYRSLWDPVLKCAQVFSVVSGSDVGVRFVPLPGGLRVDMYQPRNLVGDVRFSADLSNLVGFEYTEKAPTATYVVALGQGDLHLRTRKAAASSNPFDTRWGRRIERVVDRRDEADLTLLAQAATDEITQGAGQISLTATLTDSQAATYGTDWGLGDRVTVYVGLPGQPKQTVSDVVREISLEIDSAGAEIIRPAIGTTDAKALKPGPTQEALARVGYRLQQLIAR